MTRTAAVVGGGIGGLATAIGLRAAGWQVSVYERSETRPATGTGLGIWPSALRALDELGVGAAVRAAGLPQRSGAIRRPDGSRIVTLDMDKVRERHGEPVHLVSRPALLGVLSEALPAGVVRFGCPVDDITELRGGHDVVVAADGISSRIRTALFGDRHGLRYVGATVWRGTADLDTETGGETWGVGARFGITPQGPGRTNWYAVLAAPRVTGPRSTIPTSCAASSATGTILSRPCSTGTRPRTSSATTSTTWLRRCRRTRRATWRCSATPPTR